MARDWNAVYNVLAKQERDTFQAKQEAFARLMRVFAESGAPSEEDLQAAERADDLHSQATGQIDDFIDEWRKSQGST